MDVSPATADDFESWLDLAKECEPLFGPMVGEPAFREALLSAIGEGRAFCVRAGEAGPAARLCGAIVLSRQPREIVWLAVGREQRGRGFGRRLLEHALAQLGAGAITVQTFDESVEEGLPARRLYRALGFADLHGAGPNPAGVPTVVMIRR